MSLGVKVAGLALCLLLVLVALPVCARAAGRSAPRTWYVQAAAGPGGNGSAGAPFDTLSAVQRASAPGDTIEVLPSPLSVAPLNGGIALKPHQHLIGAGPSVVGSSALNSLPRLTNTTSAHISGDAVELADGAEVVNIVVAGSYRGGIYGIDVTGVEVQGNDVSGQNTSCTDGLFIPPFTLGSYAPFVGADFAIGVQNGWAAIMVDGTKGLSTVSIEGNRVRDGVCGDGIDVRAMGSAAISAVVRSNDVTRLLQGTSNGIDSVLAIGMQAIGTGRLRVNNTGNTETYIGDPGNGNTDCEGQFVSIADSGNVSDVISHNTFQHGIGDFSCNGMEFVISNGDGTGYMHVIDSNFYDDPGDMLEEFNFGAGARMALVLDHVLAGHTTLNGGTAPYSDPAGDAPGPGNLGDCLTVFDVGADDVSTLVMRDSRLYDCDNNGLEVNNNVIPTNAGSGPGLLGVPRGVTAQEVGVDIERSSIVGSRYYALWLNNMTPLRDLHVKVQDSNLSAAGGEAVAFDQQASGSTQDARIDLGGGPLGSLGGNCIFDGGITDLETTGYVVAAKHDWWGAPGGPPPGDTKVNQASTSPGKLTVQPALSHAPSACMRP
jgi:hypothetical protein